MCPARPVASVGLPALGIVAAEAKVAAAELTAEEVEVVAVPEDDGVTGGGTVFDGVGAGVDADGAAFSAGVAFGFSFGATGVEVETEGVGGVVFAVAGVVAGDLC